MRSLHLHNLRIGSIYNRSTQYGFTRKVPLIQDIHRHLYHTVTTGRINKRGIQLTIQHLFYAIPFTGQSIRTDKAHFFCPTLPLSNIISSCRHSVVLCIHYIYFRKARQKSIHLLSCLRAQPTGIFTCQKLNAGIRRYGGNKSLMTVHGRCRTRQTGYLHNISLSMKHISNIVTYCFS